MFTPKFLAVTLAAAFSLTACNSSTTKPENLGEATGHGPKTEIFRAPLPNNKTKKIKKSQSSRV